MICRMRLLGIDYGKKRVGIAVTDELGQMAFPHDVVPTNNQLLKYVEKLVAEKKITEIVIGHSKNMDGTDNVIQSAIEEFITDLTLHLGLPVHLEMEHYSTQEAIRFQGKNDKTDASAATIILNSYITKRK